VREDELADQLEFTRKTRNMTECGIGVPRRDTPIWLIEVLFTRKVAMVLKGAN